MLFLVKKKCRNPPMPSIIAGSDFYKKDALWPSVFICAGSEKKLKRIPIDFNCNFSHYMYYGISNLNNILYYFKNTWWVTHYKILTNSKHVLHVGDSMHKDYLAAVKCGCNALLLDSSFKYRDSPNVKQKHCIDNLNKVLKFVH